MAQRIIYPIAMLCMASFIPSHLTAAEEAVQDCCSCTFGISRELRVDCSSIKQRLIYLFSSVELLEEHREFENIVKTIYEFTTKVPATELRNALNIAFNVLYDKRDRIADQKHLEALFATIEDGYTLCNG